MSSRALSERPRPKFISNNSVTSRPVASPVFMAVAEGQPQPSRWPQLSQTPSSVARLLCSLLHAALLATSPAPAQALMT